MLAIIVLEDNENERKIIQKMIENRISVNNSPEEYDAKVVLSTGEPQEVISFVKENNEKEILAYLDIDLKTTVDGIEVASRIKGSNLNSQIVFVTGDADSLRYTIQRHVAPLDYITKDAEPEEIQNRIYETVDLGYQWYLQLINNSEKEQYFTYSRINGMIERIPLNQVYYVELHEKKYGQLRVYAKDMIFDCSGVLKNLEHQYESLVFVDRETLINVNTVKSFDYRNGTVYFDEAKEIKHKVAIRRKRKLQQLLQK